MLLRETFILLQQLFLRKRYIGRDAQLVLEIFLEEHRLPRLLILLLLVLVDGILVKIVLGVEVSPNHKGEDHCLFDPVEEAVPYAAVLDIGVQTKKAAQSDAPLDGSEGVGVPKNVLTLQVVHFGDL